MRAFFYIGVMLALVGMGIIYWNQRIPGVILLCVGIALAMIGFLGIVTNLAVRQNIQMKNRKKRV